MKRRWIYSGLVLAVALLGWFLLSSEDAGGEETDAQERPGAKLDAPPEEDDRAPDAAASESAMATAQNRLTESLAKESGEGGEEDYRMPTSMLPQLQEDFKKTTDERNRRRLSKQLAATFAGFDPGAGVLFFDELVASGQERIARVFARDLAQFWVTQDPAGAGDWIETLPLRFRNAATYSYIMGGAPGHLESIGDWILSLPAGPHKTRAVDVFGQFMQSAPDDAYYAEWAWKLVNRADSADPYMNVVAPILARADPNWAYDYITAIEDPETQRRGLRGFVEVLTTGNPMGAVEWTLRFPDPDLRSEMSALAFRLWSREGPAAAAHWLLQSGDAVEFDVLAAAVVRELGQDEEALRAQVLNDPRLSAERRDYLLRTLP